ncbi:MAG: thermonuclease family protein [Acidimicrobiia bacterium]|nr:thermonuclease family protein [Acidimicrobiia bacterium]
MADLKPFQYRARPIRVVDGDTVDLEIDLGFHIYHHIRVRLAGINAPEVRGEEKEEGKEATEHLRSLIHKGVGDWPILCETRKTGKYGRWLATLFYYKPSTNELVDINATMVKDGHAKVSK